MVGNIDRSLEILLAPTNTHGHEQPHNSTPLAAVGGPLFARSVEEASALDSNQVGNDGQNDVECQVRVLCEVHLQLV